MLRKRAAALARAKHRKQELTATRGKTNGEMHVEDGEKVAQYV
jgi:hypothetical protein